MRQRCRWLLLILAIVLNGCFTLAPPRIRKNCKQKTPIHIPDIFIIHHPALSLNILLFAQNQHLANDAL